MRVIQKHQFLHYSKDIAQRLKLLWKNNFITWFFQKKCRFCFGKFRIIIGLVQLMIWSDLKLIQVLNEISKSINCSFRMFSRK